MIGAGIEKLPEQPEKASACNPCPCCLRHARIRRMQEVSTIVFWQAGGCQELQAASSSYLASLAELGCLAGTIAAAGAGRTHARTHPHQNGSHTSTLPPHWST